MHPRCACSTGWLGWRLAGLGVAGAQALYQTVISLTLSFIVFTFGSLLVAIQVAGGQLTPRIIATTLLRDNVVRYSVGLFVFTLIFSVMALDRLETTVHEMVTFVTAVLGIACMATFLFLIDYAARLLRPISILGRVGDEGLAVIKSVYPNQVGDAPDVATMPSALPEARRIVRSPGHSEIVLAVDLDTLVREAQRSNGVVELVPQVGDFVASDEPLFVLYGGASAIDDRILETTVAFGSERTMEQDPLFSFRIMADIALKALSPAINDPTTAVLAIDQIHRLLRVVGKRQLRGETISDDRGQLSSDLPNAELGGLRPPRVHRDPQLRRRQRAGRATPAGDARQSHRVAAAPSPRGARRGTPTTGTRARAAVQPPRGPCARSHSGFAGTRRIVRTTNVAVERERMNNPGQGVSGATTRTAVRPTLPAPQR